MPTNSNVIVMLITDPTPPFLRYTIASVLRYCEKYKINLRVLSKRKYPNYHPAFEKWQAVTYLRYFQRVLFLDADIVLKEESPNIFDLFTDDKAFVAVSENTNWLTACWGTDFPILENLFERVPENYYQRSYFNSGVFSFTSSHIKIFQDMYVDIINKDRSPFRDWGEQTLLNYLVAKHGCKIQYIDNRWNASRHDSHKLSDSYFIHYCNHTHQERLQKIQRDFPKLKPDYLYWSKLQS